MYIWIRKIRDWITEVYNRIFKKVEPIVDIPLIKPSTTHVVEPIHETCTHNYVIEKQIWVRVAPKRYELQNGLICDDCGHQKIERI